MGLTLREVLEMEILKGARILTKNHDLNVEIEGINIMEAPDISEWIQGGDIILTNLYSVYDSPEKMGEFIDNLRQGKVSALFVKTKRFVEEVPAILMEEAERLRIAIVEIPTATRYVDILYFVMAAIFDSQVVGLSYFKQVNSMLSKLVLHNADQRTISEAISFIVGNPVIIYDSDLDPVCTTDPDFEKPVRSERIKEHKSSGLYYYTQKAWFGKEPNPLIQTVIPLRVFSATRAHLSVVEKNRSLGELDFIALENAITVLCLDLVKNYAVSEVERRFRQELIEDIVSGRNVDSLPGRVGSILLDTNSKYAVIVTSNPVEQGERYQSFLGEYLPDDSVDKLTRMFQRLLDESGLRGIIGVRRNNIVIFVQQPKKQGEDVEAKIAAYCGKLMEAVQQQNQGQPFHIGYSSEFMELRRLNTLYRRAKDALKVGEMLYGDSSVCDFEKLGVFKMLCLAHQREDLQKFVPDSIKLLLEYEQQSNLDLINTLTCFFANNGNAKRTAEDLFIHYKTLYYRLNKIQSITGMDLKNNEEMLEAQIGLKILRLIQ